MPRELCAERGDSRHTQICPQILDTHGVLACIRQEASASKNRNRSQGSGEKGKLPVLTALLPRAPTGPPVFVIGGTQKLPEDTKGRPRGWA